jgi:hypothetical protein
VARLGLVSDARFPRDVTTDNPFLGIELKGFKMEIPGKKHYFLAIVSFVLIPAVCVLAAMLFNRHLQF